MITIIKCGLPKSFWNKQSTAQHARKVVQTHLLSKNFAEQLQQKIVKEDVQEEFRSTLEYKTIVFTKLEQVNVSPLRSM